MAVRPPTQMAIPLLEDFDPETVGRCNEACRLPVGIRRNLKE
jgi:hypothetical protein